MSSMTTPPAPLVTREALQPFTRQLVECYAPREGDPVLLRRSLRLRVFGSRGDPVIRKALDYGEVSHG
jgi:hypothetical protein